MKAKLHNARMRIANNNSELGAEAEIGNDPIESPTTIDAEDVVETVFETTPVSDVRCYTTPSCAVNFGIENLAPPPIAAETKPSSPRCTLS